MHDAMLFKIPKLKVFLKLLNFSSKSLELLYNVSSCFQNITLEMVD